MSSSERTLPSSPVYEWLSPLRRFLQVQAASGIVLLVCAIVALGLANSPWAHAFASFWHMPVQVAIGSFSLSGTLGHLVVNDGLMTIFFFVVGLEIKRELVTGELNDPRKALLPILAAVGGMVVPALVYLGLQWGEPGQQGWAIPMATDIAFVVGLLAMFGSRVPLGLKVFLLSLAIVDDLGAILIIAFVFSKSLMWGWLAVAAAGLAVTILFNYIGVRLIAVYVMVGAVVWFAFLQSGIHPTVAGVLLGLLTPATAWIGNRTFTQLLEDLWEGDAQQEFLLAENPKKIKRLSSALQESDSPLHRLEVALHPWVAFIIMPTFALANAGVALELAALTQPVALAVTAGLVIGKPVGIMLACLIAIGLKVTSLPTGVTWTMLFSGACLAGIGFTMALFLNTLTFPVPEEATSEAAGKIGTLLGSLISAVLGAVLLLAATRKRDFAQN